MTIPRLVVALALVLAAGTPALAAGKTGDLVAAGRTLSGPGTVNLGTGAQLRVHTDPGASTDVCATVANSGREPVTLTLTGDTTPSIVVNPGDVRAQCVDNVQFVDVICSGANSCTAQWRVDLN
jgi:hypothetical protein